MNLIVLEYGGNRYDWVVENLEMKYNCENDTIDFIQVVVKKGGKK
jgi:hypothetical protein